MKITMIGSTQYQDKFEAHAAKLRAEGHEVRIPAFDHHPDLDALGVCAYNRDIIAWTDEVHMIWDNRSSGTVFDFGMVFAMRKPFKIIYLETKTFQSLMEAYEKQCAGGECA